MSTETTNTTASKWWILIPGLLAWGCYGWAIWDPDAWWGLHFTAFLPPLLKVGLPVIGLLLLLYFYVRPFPSFQLPKGINKGLLIGGITVLAGLAFYQFPMYESHYGDSEVFRERMGDRTTSFDGKYVYQLLTPDILSPKNGNLTVLSAIRLLSYATGWTHRQVYRVWDALFGMMFVWIWLIFVDRRFTDPTGKFLFGLLGLTAPFLQFFFGYMEIYAPIIPVSFAYLMVLLLYLQSGQQRMLWLLGGLLWLSLKCHSASFLLVPSFLLALLFRYRERNPWIGRLFTWRNITAWIILPIILTGAMVYFFVLESHTDPRFVNPEVDIYQRLFLPIVAPAPPLDRYTLFSFSHFFDYFNLWFLWSPGILFLLLISILVFRQKIDWQRPEVILTGMTFGLYVLLFFMINPLMGMPMDWDYFILPAPALFMTTVAIYAPLKGSKIYSSIAGPVIALCLFCLPIFAVNADKQMLSQRLESLGIHIFKTYWIRSAGDIHAGIGLIEDDPEQYIARYLNVLEKLKPYALAGKDTEYANLLWHVGKYYRRAKQYEKALAHHRESQQYDPALKANYIGLMEASFFLKRYPEAFAYSRQLVAYAYPDQRKSLQIAIQCAIFAQAYDEALAYCENYVAQWPEEVYLYLRDHLKEGTNPEELRQVFE